MFTEDPENRDWVFGAVVAAILTVGLVWLRVYGPPAKPPTAAMLDRRQPEDDLVEVPPATAEAAKPIHRSAHSFYECIRNGQRVVSDWPCGSDAVVREISQSNLMPAQDTSILDRVPDTAPDTYEPTPARERGSARKPAVCNAIEAEIDSINARMRQKYTSREGEWFREQLRVLSRQRYEAKCIR
jgi:hypothetical protein